MDLTLDLDNLTLGEAADLEDISGRPFAWWVARAEDPDPEPFTARELLAAVAVGRRISVEDARAVRVGNL